MYKKIYRNMCFSSLITLILTAFMILSAAYSAFFEQTASEIKTEANMLSQILNTAEDSKLTYEIFDNYKKELLIEIYSNETAVYSNNAGFKNTSKTVNNAVKLAVEESVGEARRYSLLGMTDFFSCAIKLENGNVLCVSGETAKLSDMLAEVITALVFIAAFIYLLSVIAATRLTHNIIKPIESLYTFDSESIDEVYKEIRPFLSRIAAQNTEISRQMDKVKAQKIRLQTITENMNEGLIIFDRRGTILTANTCICDLFSITESSVKHRELSALTSSKELKNALSEALSGKKSNLTADINGKSYQIFYSPIYQNNKINAVIMLLFDVSEKHEAENMRREFSANVSHELKTPLTTIHGYAQLINQGIAKAEDILGFTKKIEKESSRLINLIDDIIKLSSLDEGGEKYEKQSVNLLHIANEVRDILLPKAAEKNLSLTVSGNDSFVFANISQISELIYNLTDNAIKYNRENGSVAIEISDKKIKITDTGIGISEEYYDRIFERFFRIDKSRSKKVNGTGLGLSIVKHIAQVNNVSISVSSTVGEGTVFTVTFN